jgi:hypothetical protein
MIEAHGNQWAAGYQGGVGASSFPSCVLKSQASLYAENYSVVFSS